MAARGKNYCVFYYLLQGFEDEKVKQMRFSGTQVIAVDGRLDKLKKHQTCI